MKTPVNYESIQTQQIEDTQRIVDAIRELFPDRFASGEITEAVWIAMQQLGSPCQAAAIISQSSVITACK